jgi:hypothetical protein
MGSRSLEGHEKKITRKTGHEECDQEKADKNDNPRKNMNVEKERQERSVCYDYANGLPLSTAPFNQPNHPNRISNKLLIIVWTVNNQIF